jgi:hypothetical protein
MCPANVDRLKIRFRGAINNTNAYPALRKRSSRISGIVSAQAAV